LHFKFINNNASIPFSQNSSFFSPEADSIQRQANRTYGLEYDGIFTQKWLGTVQIGHTPASLSVFPISGTNVPGTVNDINGVVTGNYTNAQARNSTRDEALATTTYYLEHAIGTHALK